jgi:hypothetical protein
MNHQASIPSLKEIIFQVFGVTLPIRGGMGDSMENAVIIERILPFIDHVSIEHEVVNFIVKGRDLHSWKMIKQQLLFENGKTYDKLEVNVVSNQEGKLVQHTENYYFDISDCFGPEKKSQSEEDKKMAEMKLFLDKLNEAIDHKSNDSSHQ